MSNTSKTRKLVASSDATSVPFVDEAKLLLARCLVSLNMINGAYFYEAIGSASIPGSLSHLLCVTDQQLMTIYHSCGFFNVKRKALRDYKVVEQIVETVVGGVRSPEGLDVGALWFEKRLAETNRDEFTTCSSRAGITVTARISPEATTAMWNDALVTKRKQRKILKHLFHWFGPPITAKEKDVDALVGKVYVERRYGEHSFLSRQGKKESDDDIKKRRRDITVKYWVSDPLLAAEDELITRLRGGIKITGFEFLLLDVPAIPMIFLADHGNVAWRAGLTIVGSEADGQGEPVKLAHLVGKDSYGVLEKTVNPDLRKAFELLQASSLFFFFVGKVK
jgi:hypothetical protein